MTRTSLAARAALVVTLVTPLALEAQDGARWSVETAPGPSHDLSFQATEGTWTSVSVSPDGRFIAFDLLGHIYQLPIDGGTARRLTDGRSWNLFPRYSPDGKWIAFSSDRSGSHNVWIMDREGGSLRRLPAPDQNAYRPAWSPDGLTIYAGTSGGGAPSRLVAFNLIGGQQTLVTAPLAGAPAPTPDGSAVFYERAGPGLYSFEFNPYVAPPSGSRLDRYDPATGESTVFIQRPGGAFSPAVSADGRRLAYVHRSVDETVLLVIDLATGREQVVLRGLDRDRQQGFAAYGPYPAIAWHPDGRRVILSVGGHLTAVDVETGQSRRIEFTAPVVRSMTATLKFKTEEPRERAMTRSARWAGRTADGILFEALGDLWLQDERGGRRNLTRSDRLETSPVVDRKSGAIYFAGWTDDSLGAVYRMSGPTAPAERLTSVPAQYGTIAVAPDGNRLAYVRGRGELLRGGLLSNESEFDLILRSADGSERRVTGITGQPLEYANIAGKMPPSVTFGPDGSTLYFTEFERDTLVLKRIGHDGRAEATLFKFPNGVWAVPSPDLRWIALREYQRSFVVPFSTTGQTVTVSPFEHLGFAARVDPEDGAYFTWSADGKTLGWTRAAGFYEKEVEKILADAAAPVAPASPAAWAGPRVPGSTARKTDLAIEYEIDRPKGTVALTGARVVTMNPSRAVLEGATIVIEGSRIAAVGRNVPIPAGARRFDLQGQTVIPGIVDAHAHPHIEHSQLHVIEQQPTYLRGPLAYGVTTLVEVYGNEYRDGWFTDMLRAGKITGSRLYTTGSVIFGERHGLRLRMYRPIETLDDALEQLRWNKDHGAIAVKDYDQQTRKRRHLTLTAARILGLNVVSESMADPQMNFTQLMDGVTGIEHSMGLAPFYQDVVRYWGGTSAGMTPTLLVLYNGPMGEGWYHQQSKLWEDPKLTRFITPEHLMRVRNPTHLWPEDMYAWQMAGAMKKLFANGTSIQLGAHGQMFGLDAHWELELLAKGFTPAEVLEIATIRGAAYHGLDGQIGSIEPGKLADLVVLEANPLERIENAHRIKYVVKNGVLYSGTDAARVWPDPKPAPKPYFADRP
jgi:Tol biopolymer transport system component